MIARRDDETAMSNLRSSQLGCAECPAFEHNLCEAVAGMASPRADFKPTFIPQSGSTVRARRLIVHEQDFHDSVPIICSGWAASIEMLSDGRRQILSFLLPGDIVSAGLLFAPKPRRVIEAITDVRYRKYKRDELKNLVFRRPELLDKVLKAWIAEETRADRLIVDLGRRSGDERIARLILNLVERLRARGLVRDDPLEMEFPLRQHHIADATGLTQVHVSKVISDFRRSGLIEFRGRVLTIRDLAGLRQRACIRDRSASAAGALAAL
jgi:CRP-like cAMP-binding protein